MDSRERIEAAVALRKPDRVPVVPDFDTFIAVNAGITMRELLFDFHKAEGALEKAHRDFEIDGNHLFLGGCGRYLKVGMPADWRLPGVDGVDDDEPMQMIEFPREGPEIYARIAGSGGALQFLRSIWRVNPEFRSLEAPFFAAGLAAFMYRTRRHMKKWAKRGVPCIGGAIPNVLPFDVLSGTRSMPEFLKDLHRRPEDVLAAVKAMERFALRFLMLMSSSLGTGYCFIGSARSSATFVSPRVFERFYLPTLVAACEKIVEKGMVPFMHFDSDYTPMLSYFRELPRGRCILNLDESTDIFRAKEVLGDHMCLMGNVPASLLTLGEPGEVDACCERLIREVGADGGFILSSSCSVPTEAKTENVKAMVSSVKKHAS